MALWFRSLTIRGLWVTSTQAEGTLRFRVTLSQTAASQPLTGRLVVFISGTNSNRPMQSLDWFLPEPFCATDTPSRSTSSTASRLNCDVYVRRPVTGFVNDTDFTGTTDFGDFTDRQRSPHRREYSPCPAPTKRGEVQTQGRSADLSLQQITELPDDRLL